MFLQNRPEAIDTGLCPLSHSSRHHRRPFCEGPRRASNLIVQFLRDIALITSYKDNFAVSERRDSFREASHCSPFLLSELTSFNPQNFKFCIVLFFSFLVSLFPVRWIVKSASTSSPLSGLREVARKRKNLRFLKNSVRSTLCFFASLLSLPRLDACVSLMMDRSVFEVIRIFLPIEGLPICLTSRRRKSQQAVTTIDICVSTFPTICVSNNKRNKGLRH